MQVLIPSPLHSYTGGRSQVEAAGHTLAEVLAHLDARYPGIRFRVIDEQDRIRPHIKFFVGGELAPAIARPIRKGEEVQIICALSGG
ncbi:MAG: MoaD/ThiS family protein [Acidobacteria bacterium]|nr:MoaD/ThiS family protein [Acidobacteriota bacterium]